MATEDKLGWIFELVDKMSAPAMKIARAMGKVNQAAKTNVEVSRFAQVVGLVGKVFGGNVAARVVRFAGALNNVAPHLKAVGSVGRGLATVGSGVLSVVGGIAAIGVSVAAVTGGALLGLGAVGSRFAVDAFAFKENTMAGFSTMLKSDAAARRVMQDAIQFAAQTPFETKDVLDAYRKLLVAGFKESDLRAIMTTVGDVGAAFGKDAMESVIRGVAQVRAKGKIQGEELMQLSEAGVGQGAVFDALSKKLGKTREEVQKLISAGKVDADTGIAAVMEAITESVSGGKSGSLMAKQSQTISGLWSSLASKPFEFMIALDEQEILAPVKRFITLLSEVLDPKTQVGGRIVAMLQTIGNALGNVFGTDTNAFEMSKSFNKLLDVLEPLVKMAIAFGSGFGAAIKPLGAVFSSLEKMDPAKVERLATGFEWIGRAVGMAFGSTITSVALFAGWVGIIIDNVVKVGEFFSDFPTRMRQLGADLVQGLIDGITSKLPEIAIALGGGGMAGLAISTVQSALDMHSPSKVFAGIGANTTLGYMDGLQQPDLSGRLLDMFSPSMMALGGIGIPAPSEGGVSMPAPVPSPDLGAALAGGGGRPLSLSVVVNASGGTTREQAQEIANIAVSELTSQMEQAAIEFGVA